MKLLFVICLACCGLSSASAQIIVYNVTDAGNLETALLNGYKTNCRPDSFTEVYFSFGITSINSLNIVDQEFSLNGFMVMTWNDSRLVFDSNSYGQMEFTYMMSSDIWVPPVVLNNAADGVRILSDDQDLASVPVKITSAGEVSWLAPCNYVAQCSVNIKHYPFDSQSCSLLVSSWMYSAGELAVFASTDETTVNTDLYEINGEWELTGSSIDTTIRTLHGFPLPAVQFNINLKRKYSYYLLNMILPVILLTLLGSFVFLLSTESGEKIGFALTILLSLSVVMTIVSDSIPPTSEHISVLSVYLLVTFLICTLEVLITVVSLRIHSLEDLGYTPSSILQSGMKKLLSKVTLYVRAKEMVVNDNDDIDAESMKNDTNYKDQNLNERSKSATAWVDEKKEQNADADADYYSYKDLSRMLDRLNFVVFFGLTVIVTFIFMGVLMSGDS